MLNVHAGAARLGRRCWIVNAVGAILLLGAARLSAQTVLLDESFEEKAAGTYPPATGWTTPNDESGWYPTVTTNVFDTGAKSVVFGKNTDSLYSPTLNVANANKVVLTFRVAQVPGLTYYADKSTVWWNDYFEVFASFDGAANVKIFTDFGVLDGYTGYYTGTLLQAPQVNGIAVAGFFTYEIAIKVEPYDSLKLRFRGWQNEADSLRKFYLDTVKVVTLPIGTLLTVR